MDSHYISMLDTLNLWSLHTRCRNIDALFVICVFRDVINCPSVLETVSIRVPSRNIHNFSLFCCSSSHCPSARCVLAANIVCNSLDIFRNSKIRLKNLRSLVEIIIVNHYYYIVFILSKYFFSAFINS
jgi:hypothetical protein